MQHPSRPPSTGFGSTISTHRSVGISDPEGPEKYNKTEVFHAFLLKHQTLVAQYIAI
jgi:hypothetical protein